MTTKHRITAAAELALGVTKAQIKSMQLKVDALERENQYIGLTRVRRAIDTHLVEIRLLLRDGHTGNLNRLGDRLPSDFKS